MPMKVCIGGTFNILHSGHRALLDTAIQKAGSDGSLFIGVATRALLKKKVVQHSFQHRAAALKDYLKQKSFLKQTRIEPITDRFGPTIDEDFDAIIVSPETFQTAKEINLIREKKGKKPMQIIQINYVLADDNKPISSTRIINNIIDKDGRIR